MSFHSIPEIIEEIRQGRMVIMTDDESRENEGDLIFAAQFVTPEKVNFMMKEGRGLICVPLTEERIEALGLDGAVMDEQVLPAVLRGDEPESLLIVEPLHCSFHVSSACPVCKCWIFEYRG